jgi:DNA (cytosine-5)-methyltransferase 1
VKVLDLFSGIGGFSLGLERAGFETVAFCEPNPFCQAILKKHWPTVPVYEDVRELSAERLANDGIAFDAICGGFPCQDISVAGKGAGLAGARSGLWWEFHRLIAETKPKWVIAENVSALRSRGLDEVLGSLAALGYDAEWHCIPASAVGAPHRRDRIWIVAYPNNNGRTSAQNTQSDSEGNDGSQAWANSAKQLARPSDVGADVRRSASETLADADRQQQQPMLSRCGVEGSRATASTGALDVDVASSGRNGAWQSNVAYPGRESTQVSFSGRFATVALPQRHPWWEVEPDVGRVADGVPKRLDRLKSLGNAVVPQIPEIIGRVINDPAADR